MWQLLRSNAISWNVCTATSAAQPLFDTHPHYNARDTEQFSPQQIIAILERNAIQHALVTSMPAQHAMQLNQQAPKRILPKIRRWLQDLPDYIARRLAYDDAAALFATAEKKSAND